MEEFHNREDLNKLLYLMQIYELLSIAITMQINVNSLVFRMKDLTWS